MVQPGRQKRQPAAQRDAPPSLPARSNVLARARDRFDGSLTQRFLARLKALDFADQAMLFGAGLLVSLLPFVILLSAFASQRIDDDISLRLGLDRKAAGIMDHLFTAAPATLNATTATSLVFLVFGMVAVATVAPCSRSTRRCSAKIGTGAGGTCGACWPGSWCWAQWWWRKAWPNGRSAAQPLAAAGWPRWSPLAS